MSNKTERQLKELRRLMPWTWDARVEKHPPGEKALKDFENVLSYQDQPRTRKTGGGSGTSRTPGGGCGPVTSTANAGSTGRHQQEPTPNAMRHSSERAPRSGGKRASPGQPSVIGKAGKEGKAPRLEEEDAVRDVEATPAAHKRHLTSPTAPPSSATPSAAAASARTPGTGLLHSNGPLSVLASCPHNAALTGGQFKPTPASAYPTTASRPSACKAAAAGAAAADGVADHPLRRQLLQSTTKLSGSGRLQEREAILAVEQEQAPTHATITGFRSPECRSALGKHRPGIDASIADAAGGAIPSPAAVSAAAAAEETAVMGSPVAVDTAAAEAGIVVPAATSLESEEEEAGAQGGAQCPSSALFRERVEPATVAEAMETEEPQPEEEQQGARGMDLDDGGCPAHAAEPLVEDPCDPTLQGCGVALLPTPPPPAVVQMPPSGLGSSPALIHSTVGMVEAAEGPSTVAMVETADGPSVKAAANTAADAAEEQPVAASKASFPAALPSQLLLTGLDADTPSLGQLPSPPGLTTLQPLDARAPLLQLQQEVEAHGEGSAQPMLLNAAATSLADGGTAGAQDAAAAAVAFTMQPHDSTGAADGTLKLPRGNLKGATYEERRNSAPAYYGGQRCADAAGSKAGVRQDKLLSMLSLLPSSPSAASAQSPPAVPLFQQGAGLDTNPSTPNLGRSMSDAALHSLLKALPKMAPALPAVGGLTHRTPASCPPLFKRGRGARGTGQSRLQLPQQGHQEERQAEVVVPEGEDVEMVGNLDAAGAPTLSELHKAIPRADATDKENRCDNNKAAAVGAASAAARATSAGSPRLPPAPCGPANPRPASDVEVLLPLRSTAQRGTGHAAGRRAVAAAGQAASTPAATVAPGVRAPAAGARHPALSAWRLQELSALNRSQHVRERKLLASLSAGQAVLAAARPGEAAAAAAAGAIGSPPQWLIATPQPPAQGKRGGASGGGLSGPGSSGGGRADALRPAGRGTRGAAGRSPPDGLGLGSRRGREIVIGSALGRACNLLLKGRLSKFPGSAASATAALSVH